MADKVVPAAQERSWRPLRVMLVVTMLIFVVQIVLGEIVGAAANYPTTSVSITSLSQLFSAMSSAAGPIIFVHAFFGILVVLAVLGTAFLSVRYHRRNITRSVGLAVFTVLIAILGGAIWAFSDFSNGLGIILMVNGALASYSLLFVALYYTK